MQRTIYECDHCKLEIGPKAHLTLAVGSNGHMSGIALPPTDNQPRWTTKGFKQNFIHLHMGKCIAPFFKKMADEAQAAKK